MTLLFAFTKCIPITLAVQSYRGRVNPWDGITYPCANFNDSLSEPQLKSRHRWEIAYPRQQLVFLLPTRFNFNPSVDKFNHMPRKMWEDVTYPFLDFNCCKVFQPRKNMGCYYFTIFQFQWWFVWTTFEVGAQEGNCIQQKTTLLLIWFSFNHNMDK